MNPRKILLMGAYGMLGTRLSKHLRSLGYTVLSQGRSQAAECSFDPNDPYILTKLIDREQFGVIINLVALTNVDLCEKQVNEAYRVNIGVVKAIVIAIKLCSLSQKPHLIQISTDQVYGLNGPHSEDSVNPINVYGMSKFTGELIACQQGATILRTNFYGLSNVTNRKSFSDWAIQSLLNKKKMTVFKDIKFSAIHMSTLCNIIEKLILKKPIGTFNFGCRDSISKADFILALCDLLKLSKENIKIGVSRDFIFEAQRPQDMSLNVEKIESELGIRCPIIKHEIEKTVKEYE